MVAVLLSNTELFLANFLWVSGGPLPAILLCAAALIAHIGDESHDGQLRGT